MGSRGRDKFRREISSRSEEKGHHSRSNPPSRHLWIGNLSHSLDENTFARQFLQFGELDNIAFQPARSYAFVNFKNEDDAFAAIRELQGFSLAGNPLRIEFAKAEKSTSRDDDYLQHREQRSAVRASPYPQRDSRIRHSSPDAENSNSKMVDKNGEPSEVLWIGFPAQLKVDEFILRNAFAPFGEIDKITAFPGRTYAFVRYRNVMAACRAKETLQGKLFGNPRVHICFAKSESGVSNRERNSSIAPPSPHLRGYTNTGSSSKKFRHDRDYRNSGGDLIRSSPSYMSNRELDDPDLVSFVRKNNAWAAAGDGAFERRNFSDLGSERVMSRKRASPSRDRSSHFRELSPERFSRQEPDYDDPFDLPEDPLLFHEVKRLKTCNFPSQSELPEYPPFSHSRKGNHMPSKAYPDFQPDSYGKSIDPEPFGYRQVPNRSIQPYGERSDQRSVSYDSFHMGSVPISTSSEQQRLAPDSRSFSKTIEWKWEGTIAKGGTPVCRARCLPVGKVLDMKLPEYLDCTARTGLDMLSKHYYQATGSWVVFFTAASDPDLVFYNEFMTYLGEKQRAAVAKLDDINTLFLVPPSEFSQKVLKVPGSSCISGVVLRLEQPSLTSGPFHHQLEKREPNFASLQGDPLTIQQASPSGPYPALPNFERPAGTGNVAFHGTFSAGTSGASHTRPAHSGVVDLPEHEYALHRHNTAIASTWSSHDMETPTLNPRNIATLNIPNPASRTSSQQQPLQENPSIPSSLPAALLQPEQLAQLANSLLGLQRQQQGTASTSSDWAHQKYLLPNNQVSSEMSSSSSQHAQMQMQQQQQQQMMMISNMSPATQKEFQPGSQVNQQPQYPPSQEEGDSGKSMQATLQLAAAIIQRMHQGKAT